MHVGAMGNELSVQQQALHEFCELGKKKKKRKKGKPELHWDEAARALVKAVPKWEEVRGCACRGSGAGAARRWSGACVWCAARA